MAGRQGESLNVLVVEDESLVAMMIEDVLAELGHQVAAVAGRLEEAERLAGTLPVDFAVVDLNLNGQRTFPVAEVLKRRGVPFLFATGYGAAGLENGWSDAVVLQKPFQPEELRAALSRALDGKA